MIDARIISSPLSKSQVTHLAKNYGTLDYTPVLRSLLASTYADIDFSGYTKHMLHLHMNEILLNQHNGEASFKYKLFQRAAKQTLVAAFEMPIGGSRVDFLTVNGHTTSYEIKSSLDTLTRLERQVLDYLLAFEYNYVVVDSKHIEKASKILPGSYGILSFLNGSRIIHKEASLNLSINPDAQLKLLTKKEKTKTFPDMSTDQGIRDNHSADFINTVFKDILKARYQNRWNFIVKNADQILPVDLQFFFNRNIDPEIIYHYS